jgi:DNA-binding protein H-NS
MPETKTIGEQLEHLPFDELIDVREKLDTLILSKLAHEKRALKTKLARIEKYELAGSGNDHAHPRRAEQPRRSIRKSKVRPKYRDPETGVTWSGRGHAPRWLVAAMNPGKRREDFRISDV